ncbi:ATP-binding protein [Thermodesulfobacteriota bacterium B35]
MNYYLNLMRVSLRFKLALVSLFLLLFPLLGIRLNSILKQSLLTSQQDTLALTAQAVSAALANRSDLFARERFHALDQARDLYIFHLSNTIRLDGRTGDWQPELAQAEKFGREHLLSPRNRYHPDTLSFRHLSGRQGGHLYSLFEVRDDRVVYRSRNSLRLDRSDHLRIIIEDEGGRRSYIITAHAPGWVNGFRMPDKPGLFPVPEPRIQGVWRQTGQGYILEFRIPLDLLGSRLAFTIADVDDPKTRLVTTLIGTANLAQDREPGWLLTTSTAIEEILRSLDRPYARIRIVDRNQRIRAQVGGLREARDPLASSQELSARIMTRIHDLLRPLFRFFTTSFSADIVDQASQPTELDLQGIGEALAEGRSSITRYLLAKGQVEVMAAITPLYEKKKIVGAVVVEQTTNSILALSNRLIEETVSLSLLAFLLGGGGLLLFASRISARIRRLRDQAAAAISPDGHIRSASIGTRARDEIGDLAGTLRSMLSQLEQQVEHRERMADNLEHEMRTPLAAVSASLNNLEQELEEPSPRIRNYLDWARNDVRRLEGLLTSIREATSLREALQQESMEIFDLGRALPMWLQHGWQQTFTGVEFRCTVPDGPLPVKGDPVRLRQATEKLVENAVSFHRPGTPVELEVRSGRRQVLLQVSNQGNTIPPALQARIFDSMVSLRPAGDDRPHLGLGLYIVRTILDHHGGTVTVADLDKGRQGVVFTLHLPRAVWRP